MTVEKKECFHGEKKHKRFVLDPNAPVSEQISGQLQRTSHMFHHPKGKTLEELIAPLTEDEQQELLTLLLKLAPAAAEDETEE